jgi:ATP-dependent Clp protease protease subunit
MMHQPWGKGGQGTAADIEIVAKEFVYLKSQMYDLLVKHTGQPYERIEREFDRDRYMSACEAQDFGMIDTVVEHREEQHLVGAGALPALGSGDSFGRAPTQPADVHERV